MAANLLESLKKEILVGMGALGTNLTSSGLNLGECIVTWLLDHPKEVEKMVRQFVDAGSDMIEVASAATNRFRLQPYGLQEKTAEFSFQITKLWREVTPPDRILLGTLGITSRFLEPAGDATFEEIYDSYYEQVANVAKAGVDAFWLLTMSDTREAGAAIKAVKDCTGLPVIASMVFDSNPKGFFTMMGINPQKAAEDLERWGADVVGTNCGGAKSRLEETSEIVRQMKGACECYLAAKPNAGNPQIEVGKRGYQITPEEMAAESLNWISAGARIVGGCCGTTPEHIAKISEAIRKKNS
jgi:5-methyltetrahydrofolate--homocysteine methyltransferase